MVQKEYNSPEYYAQGLRDSFNRLGNKTKINFSAQQSSGFVLFNFKNQKYSIDIQKEKKQTALLEHLVYSINSDSSWEEIARLNIQFKRSRTGKVSEKEYIKFIKQEVLLKIINKQ